MQRRGAVKFAQMTLPIMCYGCLPRRYANQMKVRARNFMPSRTEMTETIFTESQF